MNLRNIPSVNKILINKKIENLRINKVILKDISKSVLKVIMMAKLEQVLNLD